VAQDNAAIVRRFVDEVITKGEIDPIARVARREAPETACGSKESAARSFVFGMTESHAPSLFRGQWNSPQVVT
jgi:hypothetical protein